MNALNLALPFLPRRVPKADKTWEMISEMTPVLTPKTVAIKLTRTEQRELNLAMSQVRVGGLTYEEAVRRLYNSARTQEIIRNRNGAPLAEAQLSKDLSALGRSYRDVAFEKLKALYPGLMQRAAANDAMNEAARNNDNEGITRNKQRLNQLFEEARIRGIF